MGAATGGCVDAAKGMVVFVRVLLVADVSAEKLLGGAERVLMRHVCTLAEVHTLTVLTRQPEAGAPPTVTLASGVTEYRLPFSGNRGLAGLRQLLRGAKDWWQQHQGEFDVVVAEQPFVMWALLRAGCDLPRLQVCHSFAFEEYVTRYGLNWNVKRSMIAMAMRKLEGSVYVSARRLLVLSEYMRRHLIECFQLDVNDIQVAYGGVDVPVSVSREEREQARQQLGWQNPVMLTLRNLVPRTGVDMLVQAAAMLRYEMPDLRWCVMGAGELLAPLKWLTGQLDVADRIEFTGYLPEQDVHLRMQAADAFMLPTRSLEGFGLVTIEANANGLPVVATPVGANPEVVGASADNILAEATTPEALAAATRVLFARHADHMQQGERLHAHVQTNFDWQAHDDVFMHAVEAII